MNIKNILSRIRKPLFLIAGILCFAAIIVIAYTISSRANITQTITSAETPVSNENCVQTCAYGICGFPNNDLCLTKNTTGHCGGVTYCCPGPGKHWVAGRCSITDTPPPKPPAADTPKPKDPKDPGSGSPGCPPNQKNNQGTKAPKTKGQTGCNDYSCTNIAQGSNWAVNDCSSGDADGDMQICDKKGRIGTCGGKKLCCPGPGKKWTTTMTACTVGKTTLTVSPKSINSGKDLTVKWTNISSPSTLDWLAMYEENQKDVRNPVEWNYVHSTGDCTKSKGDGKEKGSCVFTLPDTVATGSYKLKLFSRDSYTQLAVSTIFKVIGTGSAVPSVTLTPTPTPTSTTPCCACPLPTPTYSPSSCNSACMTNSNCASGYACLLANTYGWVCRSASCPDSTSCNCSATTPTSTPTTTPTVTPTPTLRAIGGASLYACDQVCTSTSQCRSGYQCVYINDQNNAVCRNPKCYTSDTCVCPLALATITPSVITKGTDVEVPTPTASISATPTPTGLRLNALPTLTPTPTPIPINPLLTVKSFTDSAGKAPPKFTLSGTSDPATEIVIQFNPDAVGQTTTSDSKGAWRYILTKSLTTGNKELTVTARNPSGGETQIKQSFTVKTSGGGFSSLFIGFLFLALIGGVGFFIYQKQMSDQSSLFSQFPPVVSEPEKTESTVVSEEKPQFEEEQAVMEKPNLSPEEPSQTKDIVTDIPEEKPPFSS